MFFLLNTEATDSSIFGMAFGVPAAVAAVAVIVLVIRLRMTKKEEEEGTECQNSEGKMPTITVGYQ